MRLLVFFTLHASALQPPLAATRRTTRLAALRYFVVAAANASSAVATGQFSPNNLLEGRVDVLCRCATSALWYSNGIRADASLHLVLGDTTTGASLEQTSEASRQTRKRSHYNFKGRSRRTTLPTTRSTLAM